MTAAASAGRAPLVGPAPVRTDSLRLDAGELAELDRLFAGDAVHGPRYGEAAIRCVDTV